jgi:hypothetical protein
MHDMLLHFDGTEPLPLDLEWYIKLFLGVHFADNLA